jgi:hypothetical protein
VKQPDRTSVYEAAGKHRNGHQHQHIQWIAIVAQRARQKPIVSGVVHSTVEHPIQAEDAELLVQFVLVSFVRGDLDDRGDHAGWVGSGRDVVPGMKAPRRQDGHRRTSIGGGKNTDLMLESMPC